MDPRLSLRLHGLGPHGSHVPPRFPRRPLSWSLASLLLSASIAAAADAPTCYTIECGDHTLVALVSQPDTLVLEYDVVSYHWQWAGGIHAPAGGLEPHNAACGHVTYLAQQAFPVNPTDPGSCHVLINNTSISLSTTVLSYTGDSCPSPPGFTTTYSCANGWWEITPGNPGARVHGEPANLTIFFGVAVEGTWVVQDRGLLGYTISVAYQGTGDYTDVSGEFLFREVNIRTLGDFGYGSCVDDPNNPGSKTCDFHDFPTDDDDDDRYSIPGPYTKPPAPERPEIPEPPPFDFPQQRDPSQYENDYPDCEQCRILQAILDTLGTDFALYFQEFRKQNHEIIEWLGFLWDEAAITNEILVDLMNLLITEGDGSDPDDDDPFAEQEGEFGNTDFLDTFTKDRALPFDAPVNLFEATQPVSSWTFSIDVFDTMEPLFGDNPLWNTDIVVDLTFFDDYKPYTDAVILFCFSVACFFTIFAETAKR